MLRYVVVFAIALLLAVAMSPLVFACPSALNVIPSVDVMESRTLSFEYENDDAPGIVRTDSGDICYIQMGLTPRLEAGIDLYRAGTNSESYVNVKYQLLSETTKRPALSIGTMNIGKSGSPVYYAVAARKFGTPRLHMGAMGNGVSSQFVTGLELSVSDSLSLVSDYVSGLDGFATVGASFAPENGPSYDLIYGFANDPGADNEFSLNVSWSVKFS